MEVTYGNILATVGYALALFLIGLFKAYVYPYLKRFFENAEVKDVVNIAVSAVEQTKKVQGISNDEAKTQAYNYVIRELEAKGIKLSMNAIDTLIEAAVNRKAE